MFSGDFSLLVLKVRKDLEEYSNINSRFLNNSPIISSKFVTRYDIYDSKMVSLL